MKPDANLWGIHGGKTGDADTLFLQNDCVALGWDLVGDLEKIGTDREAFKKAIQAAYPASRPGAIPNNAGQLYRFKHEMKTGDYVIYPSKRDRLIHIGQVTGSYRYEPQLSAAYPHIRSVKWLHHVPRTTFNQGALYEIGSAMSFFQVKNYADEFIAIINGAQPKEAPEVDDTVAAVSADIEETTQDFVLKQLSRKLKGTPFEEFVAELLQAMGYNTRLQPDGEQGAIDILAHKDELGIEPPIIKVQVKSNDGNIGDPVVSSLYGNVGPGEFGLFVTLGDYSPKARAFARSKTNLRLIDGYQLVELIFAHYEQLGSRYKGIIPLKRVWVPEGIEGTNEQ